MTAPSAPTAPVDLTAHPRPTFARAGWQSLDGEWSFTVGAVGDHPPTLAYDRTITVPFPPESAASGIGVDLCEEPRYRRTFAADPAPGRRLLLHFEGVDHEARVWVNGSAVGSHTGGYTPFTLDVTDAVRGRAGGPHELVVAASDPAFDREIPRGKQAWTLQPDVIWYRRSSGIWRSVWLEEVPGTRLGSATWVTPDLRGTLTGTVHLAGDAPRPAPAAPTASDAFEPRPLPPPPAGGLTLTAVFSLAGTGLARVEVPVTGPDVEVTADLTASGVRARDLLWSPEHPRLIDIDLRLARDGAELDAVASYTGLRTVSTGRGAVRLNDRPTFLRLVLEQAYWPESHYTVPSVEAARAEARLIADLGFNGLRMHQTTADPRFLRACDELGLLVWADLPAAHDFSAAALERTVDNLTALVVRDRNHPSVIAWVPFNESWGLTGLRLDPRQRWTVVALHALARALDPTRLALGNDGWEHVVGDVIGVHDYNHDPAVLRRRYRRSGVAATLTGSRANGRYGLFGPPDGTDLARSAVARGLAAAGAVAAGVPVVLSEFGGVSLDSDPRAWKGYGRVRSPRALVARLAALVRAVGPASGLAGFCWTQLTDTLQEQNGLTWPDRTPKAPLDRLAAAVRGERVPRVRRGT